MCLFCASSQYHSMSPHTSIRALTLFAGGASEAVVIVCCRQSRHKEGGVLIRLGIQQFPKAKPSSRSFTIDLLCRASPPPRLSVLLRQQLWCKFVQQDDPESSMSSNGLLPCLIAPYMRNTSSECHNLDVTSGAQRRLCCTNKV